MTMTGAEAAFSPGRLHPKGLEEEWKRKTAMKISEREKTLQKKRISLKKKKIRYLKWFGFLPKKPKVHIPLESTKTEDGGIKYQALREGESLEQAQWYTATNLNKYYQSMVYEFQKANPEQIEHQEGPYRIENTVGFKFKVTKKRSAEDIFEDLIPTKK
jgi:hypothetical protein